MTAEARITLPGQVVQTVPGVGVAIAFAGALFGSLRSGRWAEGQEKAEVAREELARLEALLPSVHARLAERDRLRAEHDRQAEDGQDGGG